MRKDAFIDATEQYRYWLLREWDSSLPKMAFIMLNPSTADANVDDATIRRCINFAKSSDYGSIQVVNLFAYRATQPERLKEKDIDPIGEQNDDYIIDTCSSSDIIIAAWGVNGTLQSRAAKVERLIGINTYDLHCLGTSKDGYPRHPLFVKDDVMPVLYKKRIYEKVIQVVPTVESKIVSREGIDPKTMSDYHFHKDVMED